MKVYFISGLGADYRVFSLLELSFCEPVFIGWIKPQPNESLPHYAARLLEQIPETSPIIVGISFGGMLVTEMARQNQKIRAIIISSNKKSSEFPNYLRIGKYLPAYQWMPDRALKQILLMNSWVLGGKGLEEKKLLRQIINDTEIGFVKWAISAILRWVNEEIPTNLVHIHGKLDKLLPCKLVKADYVIEKGTHVMTLDNATEVSILLKKLILTNE